MKLLKSLKIADFISLSGIITIWLAILAIIHLAPFTAIFFSLISFGIDMLDGFVARRTKSSSEFGLQLDTIIDTVNYPVFTALFAYQFIFSGSVLGSIVAVIILIFSSLRLSRMAIDGIKQAGDNIYYEGVVTPHLLAAEIILFYFTSFVFPVVPLIQAAVLICLSVLMVSTIKTYKPSNLSGVIGFTLILWLISLYKMIAG
jgi:CDP-diacylglycerol--serine O-phosphatidyltransferase